MNLQQTLKMIKPLDQAAMAAAQERQNNLLKPPGSLGKLEELSVRLAGIYGEATPQSKPKALVMMAADNGIYEEGFNLYPQEITKALAEMAGPGLIGVSVLSRQVGGRLVVVDIGVKEDLAGSHIIPRKIRYGTANMAKGPAMTREEAVRAVETGIEIASGLIDEGIGVLGTGEVGICNTATSAAVIAALSGVRVEEVVGTGTGADEKVYRRKIQAVRDALTVNKPDPADPLDVLAKVGGLDIAGLVGCCLAGAARRVPVVIDGFIAGAAALLAVKMYPLVKEYLIPSHLSEEKGAGLVLELLGMEPMLLMKMRLGEGTGAVLAFHLLDASCRIINEMGTFADLGGA